MQKRLKSVHRYAHGGAVRDSQRAERAGERQERQAGMKTGTQTTHLYAPFILSGCMVMDGLTMDEAAQRLSDDWRAVFFCRRWLLGNLEAAPVDEHSLDFDFLHWLCDRDSRRLITPGVFMSVLLLMNYDYRPTRQGIQIGCTAASVRAIARRQANGAARNVQDARGGAVWCTCTLGRAARVLGPFLRHGGARRGASRRPCAG